MHNVGRRVHLRQTTRDDVVMERENTEEPQPVRNAPTPSGERRPYSDARWEWPVNDTGENRQLRAARRHPLGLIPGNVGDPTRADLVRKALQYAERSSSRHV